MKGSGISYRSVFSILGRLLIAESALLLIPLTFEIFDDHSDLAGFLIAIGGALATGLLLRMCQRRSRPRIRRREGFMLVSLAWVACSLFGMLPFIFGAHPLSVSDAFFETISGFTTTGATTIADVEVLSPGLLLWRSMTQWLGGLGILLFMLAMLPTLNEKGGIPIYNSETTGITHNKIHPRIRQTAISLWSVYIILTILLTLLLWAGPMNFFDALCHSLSGISTGGFSTKNNSIAFWHSAYPGWVLTIFMFIGGVNFSLLYGLMRGRWRQLWRNDVFRAYLLIVGLSYLALLITLVLEDRIHSFGDALLVPIFHVVSSVTSTGYSLSDYASWGSFAMLLTMLLMIVGACAGSTTGALKIDRMVALRKNLGNAIKLALYPKRIFVVRVNGNVIPHFDLTRITAFVTIYVLLIVAGALATSAFGVSIEDSFFASISCIGNNGLGFGLTGAAGGFGLLPDAVKWLMSAMMLIGRLELFSVLVMILPIFWQK